MEPQALIEPAAAEELEQMKRLLEELTPMNRTIVSDDMERAADLLDRAVGQPAVRYRYPTGKEYGTWIVPPSWNVREAYLSDGERKLASYEDHVLFVAPYSTPFEGWVSRQELEEHLFFSPTLEDAFAYQHRMAYDFHKRLKRWELSIPRRMAASLTKDRYYVKIDVDVRPGHLNTLEFTAPGREPTTVAFLTHLCHPGQANDGLSGVVAGVWLIRRLLRQPRRFTYKLLIFAETIGSNVHVIGQGLTPKEIFCTLFLETMGGGERLYFKKTRNGETPIDLAAQSLIEENPGIGLHDFHDGYGNDEMVFDYANVGIPSASIQHYPFAEYHTSRDSAEIIDWDKWRRASELALELFRRVEEDRLIRFKHPGAPHLTRYRLYADSVLEQERFKKLLRLQYLCDGQHTMLRMCDKTGLSFEEVRRFFATLDEAGLLA